MGRVIKKINNQAIVEYDKGRFDDWCVYLTKGNGSRYAPVDKEYFKALWEFSLVYGTQRIYDDYVRVYDLTDKSINPKVLDLITQIASTYDKDSEEIDIWFTVIYAGMVAEENKAFTILKKRIKRLGMHQVLIEKLDSNYAANFSKGKKWRELDVIMSEKGF